MITFDERMRGRGPLDRTILFPDTNWTEMFESITRPEDEFPPPLRILLTTEGMHHYMTPTGRCKTKRVDVTLSTRQLFKGAYSSPQTARWVDVELTEPFREKMGKFAEGLEERLFLKWNHWPPYGGRADLLMLSAQYTSIIGGAWLNVMSLDEMPVEWWWAMFGHPDKTMHTVDMDEYRSDGATVYAGYERGVAVAGALRDKLVGVDPETTAVRLRFPRDVVSVGSSFWAEMLAPFREMYGLLWSSSVVIDAPITVRKKFDRWIVATRRR